MGIGSMWHWLIVLAVVLLLFGGGKISGLMGDFAKGIKAFKKGIKDDEDDGKDSSVSNRTIEGEATSEQKDRETVA
ncbi:MAG: twin-arginine translocase TatA/TatE family subunit [Candidatus Marinimicrobia bacterium]|nr:twin-arginine translocase TatA/TatE family subunit [Candidatus Neomarinimicrobiota bacterium]